MGQSRAITTSLPSAHSTMRLDHVMLQLSLPSPGTLVFFSYTSIAELSADIPAIPARERIVPVNTGFIDGSCLYFPSKRLRSAAAACHIPNLVDFACDMKHPDVRPQRAEIFALLLACRYFTGPWMLLAIVRRWCMELDFFKVTREESFPFPL